MATKSLMIAAAISGLLAWRAEAARTSLRPIQEGLRRRREGADRATDLGIRGRRGHVQAKQGSVG